MKAIDLIVERVIHVSFHDVADITDFRVVQYIKLNIILDLDIIDRPDLLDYMGCIGDGVSFMISFLNEQRKHHRLLELSASQRCASNNNYL